MELHQWQYKIRIYIFSDVTCFSKTELIYIPFTCCINQHPFRNAFSFLFFLRFFGLSTSSLFNFNVTISSLHINFTITYQLDFPFFRALILLTASILLPSL